MKGQINQQTINTILIIGVVILILCLLQSQGTIPEIIPIEICSLIPADLGPPPPGGGGGTPPPADDAPPEQQEEVRCTDPDAASKDGGIWEATTVTDHLLSLTNADKCADITYLKESICNPDGSIGVRTVDCTAHAAWCHPNGMCAQTTCESTVNPISQASCDNKVGCQGEEDYCKFIQGIVSPNTCVCTINPANIDSCSDGCNYEGYSSWSCSDNVPAKNPCFTGTWRGIYDQYCPLASGGFLHEACCCS